MRAGAAPIAVLLTVLALSACAELGLDPLGPLGSGDEAEATAEATAPAEAPPAADGKFPVPVPRRMAGDLTPGAATDPVAAAPEPPTVDELAAAADAPHVYMALQPASGGTTSVVFAIDGSRDGTPSDEPAIRITPEETEALSGRCNPQQLRYYKFPPDSGQPVYGPDEASRGVGAKDLPGFMATAVSARMIERGIADELEQTRPQNVCTRKLFEQTIIAATTGQG